MPNELQRITHSPTDQQKSGLEVNIDKTKYTNVT